MPVSGLVVSLAKDPPLREQAVESIRQDSRIEIGAIQSNRMPIVVDTSSSDEDKQLWDWLTNLPGVLFVDVALVAFEDENESAGPSDRPASPDTQEPTTPPPHLKESHNGC